MLEIKSGTFGYDKNVVELIRVTSKFKKVQVFKNVCNILEQSMWAINSLVV